MVCVCMYQHLFAGICLFPIFFVCRLRIAKNNLLVFVWKRNQMKYARLFISYTFGKLDACRNRIKDMYIFILKRPNWKRDREFAVAMHTYLYAYPSKRGSTRKKPFKWNDLDEPRQTQFPHTHNKQTNKQKQIKSRAKNRRNLLTRSQIKSKRKLFSI